KFDKTKLSSPVYWISLFDVPTDPSCNRTCYLPHQDFGASRLSNYQGCSFILQTGFRMPGNQVFAGMIFKVFHHSANGGTVDVDVYRRHKYRNLPPLILEVFFFDCLFYYHYFTVS